MPSALTYPGVYIEEIPSGVRTITGVSTSVTAFVGRTARGPVDRAVRIFNYGDYERAFGGLNRDSDVSYAVQQFFMNGGADAYVVRVAQGALASSAKLKDTGGTEVLTVSAAEPGLWGNDLRVRVDHATADPQNLFNLFVSRVDPITQAVLENEEFRNLSMNSKSPAYVQSVVNAGSRLVKVTRASLSFTKAGFSVSGDLSNTTLAGGPMHLTFVLDGNVETLTLTPPAAPGATTLPSIQTMFDNAIPASMQLQTHLSDAQGNTAAAIENHLMLQSTPAGETSAVTVIPGPGNDISALLGFGTANGGHEEAGATEHRPAVLALAVALTGGTDGNAPGAAQYRGSEAAKTGMYALLDVDLFNLLCIPGTAAMADTDAKAVLAEAEALCVRERAFLIIDPPADKDRTNIVAWAAGVTTSRNAAVYFPRIVAADPLEGFRLRAMPASGAIAGVYARTDAERGVWKAPAGTDAVLRGTQGLAYTLTDAENGTQNPEGVNSLRSFPVYGRVVWGARTRAGADAKTDEYKYIPVRRLALYLEETLFRSTQWVVFEPNDEPLWAQIRLNITAFMQGLFRQGAFQGNTPARAYQVKCDAETTTQYDIDRGIVNILVAFAPLKPAEFVVIRIQQKAQAPA